MHFKMLYLSTAFVLAICMTMVLSVILFAGDLAPTQYKTLHFVLTYETEFLKRGLVGEAFRLLDINPWGNAPGIFSLCVLLLLSGIYILAGIALLRQQNDPTLGVVLTALWASPAAIPHLTADFGRFDALLLLLLTSWGAVSFRLSAGPSLALLTIVTGVGILSHEMALFVTAPLGLTLWWIRYGTARLSFGPLLYAVVTTVTFALVWVLGRADILTPDALATTISDQFGPNSTSITLMHVMLFGGLSENMALAQEQAADFSQSREHLVFFGFMAPFLLLLGILFRATLHAVPKHRLPALLAVLMPLGLYPFGFDYFRWLSFCLINMTVLTIWTMLHAPQLTASIVTGCQRWRGHLVALCLMFLIVGPVGIYTGFSLAAAPLMTLFLP